MKYYSQSSLYIKSVFHIMLLYGEIDDKGNDYSFSVYF